MVMAAPESRRRTTARCHSSVVAGGGAPPLRHDCFVCVPPSLRLVMGFSVQGFWVSGLFGLFPIRGDDNFFLHCTLFMSTPFE